MSGPDGRRGAFVPRTELAAELARLRAMRAGLRIVLANGCFDVLHAGHVDSLEDAASRGDLLVVALNSDASVRALKGEGRPHMVLAERARLVGALRCVGRVTSFDELDLAATLRLLRPDVHAKGSDYTAETVPEAALDRELGIEVAICGGPKRGSSRAIVARLARPGHDRRNEAGA